jgi:hypothetical protein
MRCLIFWLLACAPALACAADSAGPPVDIGAGVGVAYGMVGLNAEVGAGPVVGTASLGWLDVWGWGVGARWYVKPPRGATDPRLGWRLGAQYGVVAVLNSEDDWFFPVNNRGETGLNLSVGFRGKDLDAEVGVPFYSVPEGYDDIFSLPVKISVGVRFSQRY